jgi:hypothetical protein
MEGIRLTDNRFQLWILVNTLRNEENEAQNLLGCTAVLLIEYRPTFQMYVLPPSSGRSP